MKFPSIATPTYVVNLFSQKDPVKFRPTKTNASGDRRNGSS